MSRLIGILHAACGNLIAIIPRRLQYTYLILLESSHIHAWPFGMEKGHGHGVAQMIALGKFADIEFTPSRVFVGSYLIQMILLFEHEEYITMDTGLP